MSDSGLCAICERREAEHLCQRCGSVVCGRHYDFDRGVCSGCADTMGPPPTGRHAGG